MQVDKECVRTMIQAGRGRFSDGSRETLELPTTAEEVKAAMFVGDRKISRQERYRARAL
jgi:hypothetical protein